MLRICIWATCGLLTAFCVVGSAADPVTAASDLSESIKESRLAEQRVLTLLHRKINAVWKDVSVADVLVEIATQESIPLWIDRQAIQDEGINIDSQVPLAQGLPDLQPLDLGQITIWQAMHFLLRPLNLTWSAPNGDLEITTKTKADERLLTRVYNVSGIAQVLEPLLQTEFGHERMKQVRAQHGGGMGVFTGLFNVTEERTGSSNAGIARERTSGLIFANWGSVGVAAVSLPSHEPGMAIPEPGLRLSPTESRSEFILKMMLQRSLKAKWSDVDGDGGSISILPRKLVVRQTYHTQIEIQSLLNAVEEFLTRGTKAKALVVRRPNYPQGEDDEIVQKFDQQVSIQIENKPLLDTMSLLLKPVGIRYWIDKQALLEEGLNVDTPCTLTLKGVALRVVLEHLLESLALTALIEEGTLVITTQTNADGIYSTHVYNTADLSGIAPSRLATTLQQSTSGKWEDLDGDGGSQFWLTPSLTVIKQTQRHHAEITTLLDDIRKSIDPKAEPAAAKLDQRIYPVHDQTAIAALITSLPVLLPNWDSKQGSILRLGESLLITQPTSVHDRVAEIIGALNESHRRLHAPPPPPVVQQPVAPAPTQPPGQSAPAPAPAPAVPPTVQPQPSPALPVPDPTRPGDPKPKDSR